MYFRIAFFYFCKTGKATKDKKMLAKNLNIILNV